ncbi:MAG: hypothetical protein EOO88_62965, partial [Pedobacter sp.]
MLFTYKPAKLLLIAAGFALIGTSWISMQGASSTNPVADNPKTDKLKLLPGFKAEHLYSPSDNKEGSWVAMA